MKEGKKEPWVFELLVAQMSECLRCSRSVLGVYGDSHFTPGELHLHQTHLLFGRVHILRQLLILIFQ